MIRICSENTSILMCFEVWTAVGTLRRLAANTGMDMNIVGSQRLIQFWMLNMTNKTRSFSPHFRLIRLIQRQFWQVAARCGAQMTPLLQIHRLRALDGGQFELLRMR